MIDIDELERLAKAATPGEWIARADGWTIRAYVGNELAADGVKVAHTCAMMMPGQGSKPDIEQQVANQEFIAAANPTAILELVAEVRRLRERLEIDPRHPYDGIYCRDATIRGLDEVIDDMRSEARGLQEDASNPGARIESYSIPDSKIEIIRTEQRTGHAKWKVFKAGYCLSKFGDWEYEPMPSSRTDDFIGRCRFDSAQEAIDAARKEKA